MRRLLIAAAAVAFSLPVQADTTRQMAELYNAHFDFVRGVKSLNMQNLEQHGLATKVQDSINEESYRVNFREPYVDAYGNVYRGELRYRKKFSQTVVGNVVQMDFENFKINGIKVRGQKFSQYEVVKDGEPRFINWFTSHPGESVEAKAEPLIFEFPDGTQAAFNGKFAKSISYGLDGRKIATVSGSATITAQAKTYHYRVSEPMQISGTCRWIQSGVTTMSDAQGNYQGTIDMEAASCNGEYQLATAAGQQRIDKQHRFWQ